MKQRTYFIFFLLMFYCTLQLKAQLAKVGDELPDINFTDLVNSDKKSISSADLKDKVAVFYFWSTMCVPCVQKFPKIDSLQMKFGDKVQFILVNIAGRDKNEKEKTGKLVARLKSRSTFSTPIAFDSVLCKRFLSEQGAWTGGFAWGLNGKIIGISQDVLTEKNLNEVFSGNYKVLEQNEDIGVKEVVFGSGSPTLVQLQNKEKVIAGSAITRHLAGYASAIDFTRGVALINLSRAWLYSWAYDLTHKDYLIETSDPTAFKGVDRKPEQLYCYELISPGISRDGAKEFMKKDLDIAFGYKMSKETRLFNYGVLKSVRKPSKAKQASIVFEPDPFGIKMRNAPFANLFERVSYYLTTDDLMYFVDESGIDYNVDVDITADMRNLKEVNKQLSKYGLWMVVEKRPREVWIIRDK